jgi:hypothetical protein
MESENIQPASSQEIYLTVKVKMKMLYVKVKILYKLVLFV